MEAIPEPHRRHPVKRTRELALSGAWHGGLTRSLVDTLGRTIGVIFPGHWSHGYGPDFNDAMIEISGSGVVTGSVELHLDASDWVNHGHHLDPRYNQVVLHVVSRLDVAQTFRADGSAVPIAVLIVPDEMLFRIDARLPEIWSDLGGEVCAEDLARTNPKAVVTELHRLGDSRLHDRVTRIEGDLHVEPAQNVLTTLLFDALGYSENREPMKQVAASLNQLDWSRCIASLPASQRLDTSTALVFGLGGYLPFSPGDAHIARLGPHQVAAVEQRWHELARPLDAAPLSATSWSRARSRPSNHPVARLQVAARLLAELCDDPVGQLLEAVEDHPQMTAWLRQLCTHDGRAALGQHRAQTIVSNVVLPFAIAIARNTGDLQLEERAASTWQHLVGAEWSRPLKRARYQVAGEAALPALGERGQQGLLKLDRDYCTPRRCFECPVAASVIRNQIVTTR